MNDGMIVTGFDLVTSFPTLNNISYYQSANPVNWIGTRIAALARGFQNYRPLRFIIHYRPQVGSTSTLSLFIGTIWQTNQIESLDQIEPTLLTSSGGIYTPAWQSVMTQVPLGRCLPQQMFPIKSSLDRQTTPFFVVCRSSQGGPNSASVDMPGRIFIEYTYEFRNAIGTPSANLTPNKYLIKLETNEEDDNVYTSERIRSSVQVDEEDIPVNERMFNPITPENPLFSSLSTSGTSNEHGYQVYINGEELLKSALGLAKNIATHWDASIYTWEILTSATASTGFAPIFNQQPTPVSIVSGDIAVDFPGEVNVKEPLQVYSTETQPVYVRNAQQNGMPVYVYNRDENPVPVKLTEEADVHINGVPQVAVRSVADAVTSTTWNSKLTGSAKSTITGPVVFNQGSGHGTVWINEPGGQATFSGIEGQIGNIDVDGEIEFE